MKKRKKIKEPGVLPDSFQRENNECKTLGGKMYIHPYPRSGFLWSFIQFGYRLLMF
ncbi:MAG: hypothetical protein ACTTKE_08910 [Prevotella fusca]